MLDLAKIEAGKVEMRPVEFDVADTFSALRGMLRPLLVSETLSLSFHAPDGPCPMYTDEAKLSQILRNFISNALKFTERGAITVSAVALPGQDSVRFDVADTGLGIGAADLELIFEEFSQVENHLQRGVKGTGLGLPLCRNLAGLLNGRVGVQSTLGVGSVFSAVIPARYVAPGAAVAGAGVDAGAAARDQRIPVLVVEDHAPTRLLYEKYLVDSEFRAVPARSLREADDLWPALQPGAVILDIMLHGQHSWHWLAEVKSDPRRQHVPVLVATEIDDKRKGLALGADAYCSKPLFRQELLATLRLLTAAPPQAGGGRAVPAPLPAAPAPAGSTSVITNPD
ncbi:CheY-like chemotaxis protein [Janthinobacterium sp. CG_23.3]|uniref:ATP-binding response regulator n=1 Tax=Janthinobacterium sp. CG_23.3 TaxID=3349634 RepID=UPI0038D39854